MMRILLKNERNMLINNLRTLPTRQIITLLFASLIILFFMYVIARTAASVSTSVSPMGLRGILSYIFLIVIGFSVLLGTPQVFKDIYSATDLQMLFTMPIQTRYIFWVKYIKSFLSVPLFILIFFTVPTMVYGFVAKVSFLYFPILLIVLLLTALIGLSFAYLFNLVLVQMIPAGRANELVTIMSFMSGIFTYFLFILPHMRGDSSLTEMVAEGVPLLPNWLPVTWAALAVERVANNSLQFLLPFISFFVFAVLLIIIATLLTERGFRKGWIQLNEGSPRRKARSKKQRQIKLRHPILAIGKKEWYSMKRDMREWLVLMPVAFFFIFGLIGFFTGGGNINLSYLRNYSHISWPVGQVVLLFLYSLSNGSIAASSIGREGDSAWILRVLPVRGLHIAYGKLWISWIIPFILLTVLEVIISFLLGWSFIFLVVGILMKAVITLGSSSIGLWLGTIGAKYHPTNPQARLKVTTSLFLFVSSYIYLGLILLPFAIIVIPPELVAFEAESPQAINGFFTKLMYSILLLISYKTTSAGLVISLCIAGIIMIALSTTIIFNRLSARRIDRGITIQRVKETRDTPLFGRNKSDRGGSLY